LIYCKINTETVRNSIFWIYGTPNTEQQRLEHWHLRSKR